MVPANKRIIRNGFSCLPFWDQLWGALRHAGRTLRKKRNTGRKSKVWCREVPAHSSFNINWINIWRSFHLEVDVCRMPTASPGVGLRPSRSEYAQGVQGANGCGDHVDFCSRKKNHRENWNVSNWSMMFRWWALHWLWGFCNELHPIGPPWHCDSKNFGQEVSSTLVMLPAWFCMVLPDDCKVTTTFILIDLHDIWCFHISNTIKLGSFSSFDFCHFGCHVWNAKNQHPFELLNEWFHLDDLSPFADFVMSRSTDLRYRSQGGSQNTCEHR